MNTLIDYRKNDIPVKFEINLKKLGVLWLCDTVVGNTIITVFE